MTPNVDPEIRASWLGFAATIAICAVALWVVWDGGETRRQREAQKEEYEKRRGFYPLEEEVAKARTSVDELLANIDDFKDRVGIRDVAPFILPERRAHRGYYFRVVYDQIREELSDLARRRSTTLDTTLGFDFPGDKPPPNAEAQHWATMLQLVSKAVYLALSTEDSLQLVEVAPLKTGHRVATGPESRPPLLREYPFQLTVRGSLKDILWLLHQLSADEETDAHRDFHVLLDDVTGKVRTVIPSLTSDDRGRRVGPLIVRGMTINSENATPVDQISQLTATFDLAGMQFLSHEEREEKESEKERDRPTKKKRNLKSPNT